MTVRTNHNEMASLCRVALRALEKETKDGPIYDFCRSTTHLWNSRCELGAYVAKWAKEQ